MKKFLLKVLNFLRIKLLKMYTFFFSDLDRCSFVAMFHDVTEVADGRDKYAVSKSKFETFIANNSDRIAKSIGDFKKNRNTILITFDDGFKSTLTVALPILKKYNCHFCVFLTTCLIGQKGYLSWNDIKVLLDCGLCEIGCHSISHPMFRFLSKEQKTTELLVSKQILEERLDKKVNCFAFPYGSFYAVDRKSKKIARMYYEDVFTTDYRCVKKRERYIPRINMGGMGLHERKH